MSMPGIAVTLNAEPITVVVVQPSPVIGRWGLSRTCVIT